MQALSAASKNCCNQQKRGSDVLGCIASASTRSGGATHRSASSMSPSSPSITISPSNARAESRTGGLEVTLHVIRGIWNGSKPAALPCKVQVKSLVKKQPRDRLHCHSWPFLLQTVFHLWPSRTSPCRQPQPDAADFLSQTFKATISAFESGKWLAPGNLLALYRRLFQTPTQTEQSARLHRGGSCCLCCWHAP